MEDVGTKLVNFFVSETIKILQRTAIPLLPFFQVDVTVKCFSKTL